jgi:ribosomal protein L35AE/L33A
VSVKLCDYGRGDRVVWRAASTGGLLEGTVGEVVGVNEVQSVVIVKFPTGLSPAKPENIRKVRTTWG